MKRQQFFSPTNYALSAIIILLLISLSVLLTKLSGDIPSSDPVSGKAVPLSSGSFNQPGDIQGAASGLQNAAAITPSKLDQLQIGR